MPLMRITYEHGTLTDAQKTRFAEEVTHALLIGEGGADTPAGRSVAYVIFDEVGPRTWYVGGALVPPANRFLFDVVYPDGASNQSAKTALHAAINRAMATVLGVTDANEWVIVHEIKEGAWGVGGRTIGVRDVARLIGALPERAAYFEPLLAAHKRAHEAHDYPDGAGIY